MRTDFQMVDVGHKAETARRALASGQLRMGREAFRLLKQGLLPKGDALKLGELAGLLAAKRTPDALPLCHPIPLDKVRVWFELDETLPGVAAFCEASAHAKTGVEMEALSGVLGALLAIYDVVKQVDPALMISETKLLEKTGGKSDYKNRDTSRFSAELREKIGRCPQFSARVITVSDKCSRGEAEDKSGPELAEGLRSAGAEVGAPVIVPDERARIEAEIRKSAAEGFQVVALTGGTGLSPRDMTPEAVAAVCERLIPGVGEALRGSSSHPMASLSRSVAGQLGKTIVVALPGSRGGVADGMKFLAKLLPHALEIAGGAGH
jgi:molybdenum cofactor biosynthesis protein MoaC